MAKGVFRWRSFNFLLTKITMIARTTLLASLLLASQLFAADAPPHIRLIPFATRLQDPVDLADDGSGRIFIVGEAAAESALWITASSLQHALSRHLKGPSLFRLLRVRAAGRGVPSGLREKWPPFCDVQHEGATGILRASFRNSRQPPMQKRWTQPVSASSCVTTSRT